MADETLQSEALAWLVGVLRNPLADPARRDRVARLLYGTAQRQPGAAGESERRLMEDASAGILGKLARVQSAAME